MFKKLSLIFDVWVDFPFSELISFINIVLLLAFMTGFICCYFLRIFLIWGISPIYVFPKHINTKIIYKLYYLKYHISLFRSKKIKWLKNQRQERSQLSTRKAHLGLFLAGSEGKKIMILRGLHLCENCFKEFRKFVKTRQGVKNVRGK